MKVILSIKPEYADKILEGTKRFEFRKANFAVSGVKSVLIYATKPVGMVVGEFEIDQVHVGVPKAIWVKTRQFAGINKSFFDEYYRDRSYAVAIGVGKVNKFEEPLALSDFGEDLTAPQSFRYLPGEETHQQLPLHI